MGKKQHKFIISCRVFVLLASLHILSNVFVDGRRVFHNYNLGKTPKGTVKSIEVPEDGDVIDCVLIHKQPAFDHPLIKDLEVNLLKNDNEYPKIYQNWHKYGECPEETVPVRRTRNGVPTKKGLVLEDAHANMPRNSSFRGVAASISVWNPKVEAGEFSLAHIFLQSGFTYFLNSTTIEAGWIVYPERYHDSQPRLYIYWATDTPEAGCFDLDCPGFVQLDKKFAIGAPIKSYSADENSIFEPTFYIYKSPETGNWNFKFQEVLLGYWPGSIVVSDHADEVEWGGEVMNSVAHKHHTTTEMGNGLFSKDGNLKSAYIRDPKIINKNYVLESASNLQTSDLFPNCYDVTIVGKENTIYYGGSGYSAKCNFTVP